jgi:hypothetical protein
MNTVNIKESTAPTGVICMTAMMGTDTPPHQPFVQKCAYSWHHWAEKHGYDFILLDEEFEDQKKVPGIFQRMKILENLEKNGLKYDQICAVDWDTFIMPWAPNFFRIVNGEFGGVVDGGYAPALNRSIRMVRENWFPQISNNVLSWANYFNGGFVVYGKKHKPALDAVYDFFHREYKKWCETNKSPDFTDDQTILNFTVRAHGFPVVLLPRSFNVMDNTLRTLLDNQTDALGRTLNPETSFRDVTNMVHITGDSGFRNSLTDWLFKTYVKELGL